MYDLRVPVHIVQHPLVHDALATLRDKHTSPEEFRRTANRISLLLAAEALTDLPTRTETVGTPLGPAEARRIATDLVVVPVLRAGLGMLDAVLELVPQARVGHIGLQRDEITAIASRYYTKFPPDMAGSHVLIIDPMLATGGSAASAVASLKRAGATRVRFLCLVAAPEGVTRMHQSHPDVTVYCASLDRELNAQGYILPGLGDAGDRLFGTR